jgi:hypothetical protein
MVKGPHTYFVLEVGVLVHNCGPGADEEFLKSRLLELNENHNILREREAKYGIIVPLDILTQIDDHERAIKLAEKALADKISFQEFLDETKYLQLDVSFNKWINETLQTPGDFKNVLKQLHENRNILKERQAKLFGNEPLALLNQITDQEHAIEWVEEALTGEISIQEFIKESKNLILEPPSVSILRRPLNTQDDFDNVLKRLHKNRNILKEREAQFGGMAPPSLLHQIDDYEYAIKLAEKARVDKASIEEFIKEIRPLILDY